MDTEPNALFLSNRRDDLDPVLEVLPHLFVGVFPIVRERYFAGLFVVERRGDCTTSDGDRRGAPDHRRHPVVAKDWNSGAAHVLDSDDHLFDLLVALRPIDHDVVIKLDRNVFDR